jgi:acyl-CoA synthetase (AMP-forming)/AMP-acid ligase II
MTFLAHAVRLAAREHGARTALVAGRGPVQLTFEQLNAASEAFAARLAVRGVGRGHVAALLMPSSIDYVVAYCALAKVGAVTTGIGPHYSLAERAAMLEQARPSVVIGTEDLLVGRLPDAQIIPVRLARDRREYSAGLPILGRERKVVPGSRGADARHSTVSPKTHAHQSPEAIVFTSGTTGLPKGALFCAGQIEAIAGMDVAAQSGPMPLLVATGLGHVGFMTKLAGHLMSGNRLHFLERWRAQEALELLCAEGIPVIGGVASQVALLLRVPGLGALDTSNIKALIIGGGPSPADLVRQAREAFGAGYSIRYSSTESGGLGTLTAMDASDAEIQTVGRPRPGTEVSMRDEDGREVPAGEAGEVWLRAPSVMAEYWRNPEATALALTPDGWLRTGDLGFTDPATGCLRLAGRRDDMFIRGGYNVHPQEVEAVLQEHPDVSEIAVVPQDDPVMGQIGVACVVRQNPELGSLTLADLREFAGDRLARHKLPEGLRVVDRLPLTSGQKLDRSALRKLVAG